jgi:hypothetical protein
MGKERLRQMTTEMIQALSELDSILELLEAKLPTVSNPQNDKMVKSLERDMVDYFKDLELSLDWNAFEALYYKHVKQD